MKTAVPQRSNDVNLFAGIPCRWGLGYMISTQPGLQAGSAGSLSWAEIFDTYYSIDLQKRFAGVFLTQILPFADGSAMAPHAEFEKALYGSVLTPIAPSHDCHIASLGSRR